MAMTLAKYEDQKRLRRAWARSAQSRALGPAHLPGASAPAVRIVRPAAHPVLGLLPQRLRSHRVRSGAPDDVTPPRQSRNRIHRARGANRYADTAAGRAKPNSSDNQQKWERTYGERGSTMPFSRSGAQGQPHGWTPPNQPQPQNLHVPRRTSQFTARSLTVPHYSVRA